MIFSAAVDAAVTWNGHKPYVRADYQFTTAQTALLPSQDEHNAIYDSTIPGLPITKRKFHLPRTLM